MSRLTRFTTAQLDQLIAECRERIEDAERAPVSGTRSAIIHELQCERALYIGELARREA